MAEVAEAIAERDLVDRLMAERRILQIGKCAIEPGLSDLLHHRQFGAFKTLMQVAKRHLQAACDRFGTKVGTRAMRLDEGLGATPYRSANGGFVRKGGLGIRLE